MTKKDVFIYGAILKSAENIISTKEKSMKKTAKTFLVLALSLVMLLMGIPTSAAGTDTGISPRLSHMGGGAFTFSAHETGGHVDISYEGYSDSFVQATVTVKLQKKFLFFFWTDVDEWSATSTELWDNFYHCFELDGRGTYKATMRLEVLGTDGTVDVIEDSIESTY